MYIEERINQLENKVVELSRKLEDALEGRTSDKRILNFYTYEVPMPWEEFTETVVGVSIDGQDLTYKDQDSGLEHLVLDRVGASCWISALVAALPYLPIGQNDHDEIFNLIAYLSSLDDFDEERKSVYDTIVEKVDSLFKLKFDNYLICDYYEFTL